MDALNEDFQGFRSVSTCGNTSHVDLPLFRYELFERDLKKVLNVFLDDFTECRGSTSISDQPIRRTQLFIELMCKRGSVYKDIASFTSKHQGTILGMVHKCVSEMGKIEEVRGIVLGGTHGGDCAVTNVTVIRCAIMVQLCGSLKLLLPDLYEGIEPMLQVHAC